MSVAMLREGSISPGFPPEHVNLCWLSQHNDLCPSWYDRLYNHHGSASSTTLRHQPCARSGTVRLGFSGLLFWGCSLHLWSDPPRVWGLDPSSCNGGRLTQVSSCPAFFFSHRKWFSPSVWWLRVELSSCQRATPMTTLQTNKPNRSWVFYSGPSQKLQA